MELMLRISSGSETRKNRLMFRDTGLGGSAEPFGFLVIFKLPTANNPKINDKALKLA
jgi:hypothetical protein